MKTKVYHSFSCLRQATATRVEIIYATEEELSERRASLQALKRESWLCDYIYWVIDLTKMPPYKGEWISESKYLLLSLLHNDNIIIGKGTRKEYFRFINSLNKR